jgi:hypothetical protein
MTVLTRSELIAQALNLEIQSGDAVLAIGNSVMAVPRRALDVLFSAASLVIDDGILLDNPFSRAGLTLASEVCGEMFTALCPLPGRR